MTARRIPPQEGWNLQVFNAAGPLSNGFSPIYAVAALDADHVVAMGSGTNADDPSRSYYIAFTTGNGTEGKYGPLSNIQCEVIFTPMSSSVSVNVTNRAIAILPLQETNQPLNAPNITNRVTYTFNNLGSVFAMTLGYLSSERLS